MGRDVNSSKHYKLINLVHLLFARACVCIYIYMTSKNHTAVSYAFNTLHSKGAECPGCLTSMRTHLFCSVWKQTVTPFILNGNHARLLKIEDQSELCLSN
jgi:hypothetical protein